MTKAKLELLMGDCGLHKLSRDYKTPAYHKGNRRRTSYQRRKTHGLWLDSTKFLPGYAAA